MAARLIGRLPVAARSLDSFAERTLPCGARATQARGDSPLGGPRLLEVIIHDDENFERALKRFKKKCEKAGILSDLRKHRHYEKPSERRKRKAAVAMRKSRRGRHA